MANDIASVSQSAISAYSTQLNNAANNVANMNTEQYKPYDTTLQDTAGGGVTATTTRSIIADQVDLSKQAVDMMTAEIGIKANVQVVSRTSEMQKSIIDMMA